MNPWWWREGREEEAEIITLDIFTQQTRQGSPVTESIHATSTHFTNPLLFQASTLTS